MFDINSGEFVILALVAIIVVGPARLPEYAKTARDAVSRAMHVVRDAKASIDTDVAGLDLDGLDLRQYDPRAIVRDALREPAEASSSSPASARSRQQHSHDHD